MQPYESYIAGWHARWAEERRRVLESAKQARRVADRLASFLRDHYSVRRVILLGSLARGEFGLQSDIDLAVEGLEPSALFRAGADLEAQAGGYSVDLVPLESADAAFLEEVRRDGVVLYERSH